MKAKHAIILLVIGFCIEFLGRFRKVVHAHFADELYLIALILKIGGALLLLYKILTYPKWKDFLNR